MSFTIGQAVQALDDDLEGVIIQIEEDQITVESHDGFLVRFRESEIIPLHTLDLKHIRITEDTVQQKESSHKKPKPRLKPKERNQPPMEVDLHIHQLTKQRGMSNHEMLTLQIETAERQLQFAIRNRIPKVVFIHGVGKGVLRSELEFLFGRYDQVRFYDANYQKYGVGALEVYIYQNPSSPQNQQPY